MNSISVWPRVDSLRIGSAGSWMPAFQTATLAAWCGYFFDHLWWHWLMLIVCLLAGIGLGRLLRKSYAPLPRSVTIGFMLFLAAFASYFFYQFRPFTGYFVPVICVVQIITGMALGSSRETIHQHPVSWPGSVLLMFIPHISVIYLLDSLWVVMAFMVLYKSFHLTRLIVLLISIIAIKSWQYSTITLFSDQKYFEDKLIGQWDTGHQQLHMTLWKGEQYIFQNKRKSFSTLDAALYYEPMAHVPLAFAYKAEHILILGGENGLLAKELLNQPGIRQIDVLPYDRAYLNISQSEPSWQQIHQQVWQKDRVRILKGNASQPEELTASYDLIMADLPDPVDTIIATMYSQTYYQKLLERLGDKGIFLSQAGAYDKQCRMHHSIQKTLESLGFVTDIFHQQIPTIDHWSWVMAQQDPFPATPPFFHQPPENSQWLTKGAFELLLNEGQNPARCAEVKINTLENPVIIRYATPANP